MGLPILWPYVLISVFPYSHGSNVEQVLPDSFLPSPTKSAGVLSDFSAATVEVNESAAFSTTQSSEYNSLLPTTSTSDKALQ